MMNNSDTIIPFIISRIDLKMKKMPEKDKRFHLTKIGLIPYNKIKNMEDKIMKVIQSGKIQFEGGKVAFEYLKRKIGKWCTNIGTCNRK